MAVERVLVVGGGIAGLATALALENHGREVVIVERDPEPPQLSPDRAFEEWKRPGVPQFRHAHMFLSRLCTMLRERHPALLDELMQAGLERASLDEVLPASQVGSFPEQPDDEELLHLWGRRPTFEYVLRRHVGRLPHVRFVHDARVERLLTETDATAVRVHGVELTRADRRETLEADLVVDASGKHTRAAEWLEPLGVKIDVEDHPSRRIYVCRHYRWLDPGGATQRSGGGQHLDYFGFATFFAEHGHFSITLSCPVEEHELSQRMRRPEGFDALCKQFPVLAAWIARSRPTTKVLGAGGFANRWKRYGAPGGRKLSGYFPVGDSQIETNPMFGRGCTAAVLQAEALAEVLDATPDPEQRFARYVRRTDRLMKPHFDFCVRTDGMFKSNGRRGRGEALSFAERALHYAFEEIFTPAMNQRPLVAREMLRSMQMRELSSVAIRLRVLWQLLWTWLRGRFVRAASAPSHAPSRAELLAASANAGADAQAAAGAEAAANCATPLSTQGRGVVG